MTLDNDACYRALLTHDARFDGTFYVGISSTGIYCRTVCTARTPRRDHCAFYSSAAEAERAGYRPCLRCRPELSPGRAHADSVSRLAVVAASRIEEGEEAGLEQFAASMGVTARHLRRVLKAELGVSPIELAQTRRLLLAKQLLTDTSLPVTRVAFASGFSSVRQLNRLFQQRYRLNPSALRRARRFASSEEVIRCTLAYRPPYAWDAFLRFLERRSCPGVESVVEHRFLRSFCVGEHRGWLAVQPDPGRNRLIVEVSASLSPRLAPVLARVKRVFDLAADPLSIASHLGSLAADEPGLRVPGAFSGFEIGAAAILGQSCSVEDTRLIMERVVTTFGEPVETPFPTITHLFPTPRRVAEAGMEAVTGVGVPEAAAKAICALAEAMSAGKITLRPTPDAEAAAERLQITLGVTEASAQYVAMRALSWPDAFPEVDLAPGRTRLRPPFVNAADAEEWRPWRAYAAMHLWNNLENPL